MAKYENIILTDGKKPRFFYGYVIVLASFIIYGITFGILTAFGVFFKPMLTEMGWTRAITSGGYSLCMLLIGLLSIPVGRLTDKYGPRKVITILGPFTGIGCILLSQVHTLWQLYLYWGLVFSIGASTAAVPVTATIARWFVKRRGLMMGVITAGAAGLGGTVMSPLTGWLIDTYEWRTAFVIVGVITLLLTVIPAQWLKYNPSQIGQLPYGANEIKEPKLSIQVPEFSFKEAIRTPQLWMMGVISFSYGFCRSSVLLHITAHTTDLGFSLAAGSYVLATITALSIVSGIGAGRLADTIGNRKTLITGYMIAAIIVLYALIARELWMLFLFAIFYGFSRGTRETVRFSFTSELFGLGALGVIMGFVIFASFIGSGIGALMTGKIFDATGSYNYAFMVLAANSVIATIIAFLLKPLRKESKII